MASYNLTKMAVDMHCPGNIVQLDEADMPSILVYIPAFKNSDVLTGGNDSIHPAFIVNGRQIPGFYYSKYENVVYNGKAYSLPAEDPQGNINFDTAREACENKGYGWHLATAAEWAAVALWSKKNGHLPKGNNNYGLDSNETEKKAIPTTYNDDGTVGRVAVGTGPLTWSHDGTASGIWDMNGNVSEWQGGMRFVWGELQVLADNDAADADNPQNATSTCWKAINAADGSLVDPECLTTDTEVKTTGSTIKFDYVNNTWIFTTGITNSTTAYVSCTFANVSCSEEISNAAKVILRALALLPDEGAVASSYEGDAVSGSTGISEGFIFRGRSYASKGNAGIFSYEFHSKRANAIPGNGFRATYIPNL
ncbi:MAG: SUMF1/EgtB/PvdO family nonheme iron enzyme [Clostridia bacterium]|nr:SUMF1/EgtB/PvdO family nonheme iron enzyme [Clostridia bacterium]